MIFNHTYACFCLFFQIIQAVRDPEKAAKRKINNQLKKKKQKKIKIEKMKKGKLKKKKPSQEDT